MSSVDPKLALLRLRHAARQRRAEAAPLASVPAPVPLLDVVHRLAAEQPMGQAWIAEVVRQAPPGMPPETVWEALRELARSGDVQFLLSASDRDHDRLALRDGPNVYTAVRWLRRLGPTDVPERWHVVWRADAPATGERSYTSESYDTPRDAVEAAARIRQGGRRAVELGIAAGGTSGDGTSKPFIGWFEVPSALSSAARSQPAVSEAVVGEIAKEIARSDKIWKNDSVAVRIAKRGSVLDLFAESRHALHSFGWLVSTGRLSAETEARLLALPPRAFAELAIRIAAAGGPIRDGAETWKAAAASDGLTASERHDLVMQISDGFDREGVARVVGVSAKVAPRPGFRARTSRQSDVPYGFELTDDGHRSYFYDSHLTLIEARVAAMQAMIDRIESNADMLARFRAARSAGPS